MTRTGALVAAVLALVLAACASGPERPSAALGGAATPSGSAPALQGGTSVEPSRSGGPASRPSGPAAPTASSVRTRAGVPPPKDDQPAKEVRPSSTRPAPRPAASAAPASPTSAPSVRFAVTIKDFAFSPRVLSVPVGSTVTVTNQDEATHDWTSRDGVWRSGDLPQGASYSVTFPTSGTFDYLCTRHPQMTGSIVVTPR